MMAPIVALVPQLNQVMIVGEIVVLETIMKQKGEAETNNTIGGATKGIEVLEIACHIEGKEVQSDIAQEKDMDKGADIALETGVQGETGETGEMIKKSWRARNYSLQILMGT